MSKEATVNLPATGSAWVEERRAFLNSTLASVIEFKRELETRDLWRDKDERRLDKVVVELGDFLTSIAADPDRSYAAHKDLCLSGPNFSLPCSPCSWIIKLYVWRVDGHMELLQQLARVRLAYDTMLKNPPAQPVEEMSVQMKLWRSRQHYERFIYEDCENRPQFQQYLKDMEVQLERAVDACGLDATSLVTARYRLANVVLQVTGATRLQLQRLSLDMSAAELLAVTEVAVVLPQRPELKSIDPAADDDDWNSSFESNRVALNRFLAEFQASWRKLTDAEIAAVLERFS